MYHQSGRESQINHATSRGGRGQSYDQCQSQTVFVHVQNLVAAISDRIDGRTQVLHSRTTVARSVAGGVARSG